MLIHSSLSRQKFRDESEIYNYYRVVFTSDGVRVRVVIRRVEAYDVVKTAVQFCLRLQCLRSAYDLVKTRLSEWEAEAEG